MTSLKCKLFTAFLRAIKMKQSWEITMTTGRTKAFLNVPEPPKNFLRKIDVQTTSANSSKVFILSPKEQPSGLHILYVHGGGFIYSMTKFHWKFVLKLVEQLHCTIILPDYPLLPDHNYKDLYAMIEPIYTDLVTRNGSENTVVMGDSAGASFVLSLMQKLKMKSTSVDRPSQIILLSPWLDLGMSNPEISSIDPKDVFLDAVGLRMVGKAYAGDVGVDDFLISPIHGPVEGLANISMFSATYDICTADARKFKSLCDSKGVPVKYYEYDEMPHNWMLFDFPESDIVMDEILALLRQG